MASAGGARRTVGGGEVLFLFIALFTSALLCDRMIKMGAGIMVSTLGVVGLKTRINLDGGLALSLCTGCGP